MTPTTPHRLGAATLPHTETFGRIGVGQGCRGLIDWWAHFPSNKVYIYNKSEFLQNS